MAYYHDGEIALRLLNEFLNRYEFPYSNVTFFSLLRHGFKQLMLPLVANPAHLMVKDRNTMKHWYALHCKPRKEQVVYEQLLIRAIEVFFPRIPSRNAGKRKPGMEAYFPGYIFAHVDLDQISITSLQWLPGLIDIVNFGGIPAHVPDTLINTIRSKIDRINYADGDIAERIKPGDMVDISGGPFAGHKAIFDSRLSGGERARVLLTLLNHQTIQIQLPISQLHS